ncbi:uncharacterized protein H6S33_002487 [Morchella sextelata]|uniref:uncharacterized protein n=1 Tax=Morchella sextelata TaxID=1174677 RepID=UPI001D04E80E|nr:uncharacterized protein H6S33_002487 [Morchella sextelata]KAH0607453.1 hypothetical protein H6S33_002487 [Morchella sextelata]
MARSRGGARPAAAPVRRSAPAPQQTRQASTASVPAKVPQTAPPAVQQAQAPAQQGPGLFGQMASTAAGVAVGSTVGHMLGAGISGMFGGSSSAEAPAAAAEPVQAQSASNSSWGAPSCEADARSFTKCLDENQGNMQICSWYLDQLKACQSMARNYNQ